MRSIFLFPFCSGSSLLFSPLATSTLAHAGTVFRGVIRGTTVPTRPCPLLHYAAFDVTTPSLSTAPLAPPWRSGAGAGGCSVHTCAECLLSHCPPGIPVPLAHLSPRQCAAHPSRRMVRGAVQNPPGPQVAQAKIQAASCPGRPAMPSLRRVQNTPRGVSLAAPLLTLAPLRMCSLEFCSAVSCCAFALLPFCGDYGRFCLCPAFCFVSHFQCPHSDDRGRWLKFPCGQK